MVKDVAAHLLVGPTTSMPEFMMAMATSRFDFDKANRKLTATRADRPTQELVALIREHADSRFTPPRQDWSHGSGPRVAGTAEALGLALTRREAGSRGSADRAWTYSAPG